MASWARATLLAVALCSSAGGAPGDGAEATCKAEPQKLHGFWYDLGGEIQAAMRDGGHYRKGDIIICVPAKSGTTWTMNVVHQIRSGGDPDLRDIYEQIPWLQFWESPYQPMDELIKKIGALPTWFPRAFKTHSAIDMDNMQYNPDLKYIIVMRNPLDVPESFVPFMKAHSQAFFDFWASDMAGMFQSMEDADTAWRSPFLGEGNFSIDFLKSFWDYRHKENVLVMHYSDMKADHAGMIRKVASFMGYDLAGPAFARVSEYTSFAWMKEHEDKFSVQHLCKVPVLVEDGMVRQGGIGRGKKALSAELVDAFNDKLSKVLTKEQARWLLEGGSL